VRLRNLRRRKIQIFSVTNGRFRRSPFGCKKREAGGGGGLYVRNPLDHLREILCRGLCRNHSIPACVTWARRVSLAATRKAVNMRATCMNTALQYRSLSLTILPLQSAQRIDTEEVDGSNPFGPTIPTADFPKLGPSRRSACGFPLDSGRTLIPDVF